MIQSWRLSIQEEGLGVTYLNEDLFFLCMGRDGWGYGNPLFEFLHCFVERVPRRCLDEAVYELDPERVDEVQEALQGFVAESRRELGIDYFSNEKLLRAAAPVWRNDGRLYASDHDWQQLWSEGSLPKKLAAELVYGEGSLKFRVYKREMVVGLETWKQTLEGVIQPYLL